MSSTVQTMTMYNTGYFVPHLNYLNQNYTGWPTSSFYIQLLKHLMTEAQLEQHGFPVQHVTSITAYVREDFSGRCTPPLNPSMKRCCRCRNEFLPNFSEDNLVKNKDSECVCTYHWGKLKKIDYTIGPPVYTCCSSLFGKPGCTEASTHVYKDELNGLLGGFLKTQPFILGSNFFNPRTVYSLDCEMCYTEKGMEITRVTLISEYGFVVYDELVNPSSPIIDYNTRFSGLTAEDFKFVIKTLTDVQFDLLSIIYDSTILVGHGLENDLKLLKLVHTKIVDTTSLYPHKHGLPYRRALKELVKIYLHKDIQAGTHDSKEDAVSCMELVASYCRYKRNH
ncbi:RNA exonuclease 1 [Chamberlinius hualienensis]